MMLFSVHFISIYGRKDGKGNLDVFEDIYLCDGEDENSVRSITLNKNRGIHEGEGFIGSHPASLVHAGIRKVVDIDPWDVEQISIKAGSIVEISYLRYGLNRNNIDELSNFKETNLKAFT
jgi:hypothetical protein